MQPFSLAECILKGKLNFHPDGIVLYLVINLTVVLKQLDGKPSRIETAELTLMSKKSGNFFNRCFKFRAEKKLVFPYFDILPGETDNMIEQ